MRCSPISIDITPPIGSNVREDIRAKGVNDNLYCNVILLESSGAIVCFLSMDLIALQYYKCRYIKAKIEKVTGAKLKTLC